MPTTTESGRLRVVGQELEQKKVSDFEVVVEGDAYRVKARVPPAPPAEITPQPKRKLTDLFKPKAAAPAPVDPNPVPEEWEQVFSRSEIDRLDGWHKAKRTRLGAPDDYAVSQVLRVVGAFAEQRHWSLVGVSRSRQMIQIRHRDDASGELVLWEQKYADLYDFSAQMFKARRVESQSAATM